MSNRPPAPTTPQPAATRLDRRSVTEQKVPGLKNYGVYNQDASNSAAQLTVEEMEFRAREQAVANPFLLMYLGNLAALRTIAYYLVSIETFCCASLTVGLTCYWYYQYDGRQDWNGRSLDFILLSFVVISPISAAIGMAFQRRERALIYIAQFRTFSAQLYLAHGLWDWPEKGVGGREAKPDVDWLGHGDAVLAQLIGIGDELSRFLTLPTTSRSRHRMTKIGRREASRTVEVAYHLIESMSTQRLTRLSIYAERLKKLGLPSGEISRLRQYERFIADSIEQLRMVKMYRTPQALRSLARTFTLILPPFYAPAFAQVAHDVDSLGVGIANGVIVALALTGLFLSLEVLEDPFTAFLALDGIDCREEFEVLHFAQLIHTRDLVFPGAPPFPSARRAALVKTTEATPSVVGVPPKSTRYLGGTSGHILIPGSAERVPTIVDMEGEDEEKGSLPEKVHFESNVSLGETTLGQPHDFELGMEIDAHDDTTVRESGFLDEGIRERTFSRGDLIRNASLAASGRHRRSPSYASLASTVRHRRTPSQASATQLPGAE